MESAGLVRQGPGWIRPSHPAAALANSPCDSAGQQDRAGSNGGRRWRSSRQPAFAVGHGGVAVRARGSTWRRAFAERWLALAPTDAEGLQLAARIEQKLGDNLAAERHLPSLQAISPAHDCPAHAMTPPSGQDPPRPGGCGERLKQAREAAGLSIDDVAARLHMPADRAIAGSGGLVALGPWCSCAARCAAIRA